ncbi:hypothetical protein MPSEU_000209700 [Mayamaea pseudoterrestris]|nr:hypothetical protein MPSEU_000209700 [Mayamaea pseudoterrestris]
MVQYGRSARKKNNASGRNNSRGADEPQLVNKASSLISSSVSLDGQSLQLPEEYMQSNVAASSLLGITPSLDGESLMLPDEMASNFDDDDDGGLASYMNMLGDPSGEDNASLDFHDDVSSINDESIAHPDPATLKQNKKYLKIIGSGSGETQKESDSELPTSTGSGQHKDVNSLQTPSKISFPVSTKSSKSKNNINEAQKVQDDAPGAGGCCCCPVWIRKAPTWLKVVFAISLILLLAAMALVGVGLTMAIRNKQASQAASENAIGSPPSPSSKTFAPSALPVDGNNAGNNTTRPTPNNNGTMTNTTDIPISSNNGTNLTVFYATGGRYPDDLMASIPDLLSSLPTNSTPGFMAHLGDWNAPSVSGCVEQDYEEVGNLFESSSIPVYFVVGDNEYNDCSDEQKALDMWRDDLVGYETEHWPSPTWEILRQDQREENYAFYKQQAIFVGINLVAGSVVSADEWTGRHEDDLDWIDANYKQFGPQGAKALVIFCHASPDHAPNADFFSQLFDRIETSYADVHFVIVHRNTPQQTSGMVRQYGNITNLDLVIVEGSVWPPMKIGLDFSGDAVKVMGDQALWYDKLQADAGSR